MDPIHISLLIRATLAQLQIEQEIIVYVDDIIITQRAFDVIAHLLSMIPVNNNCEKCMHKSNGHTC